ncbi:pilus assembly protein [Castellaniella sp.]|uniref:pilus assembly protein n=1 Tax=Castellaniella sp. TaxID=1955812 RepID=UPI002AFE9C7B|nr:pilus assembly protein [Castellaniella sp.]
MSWIRIGLARWRWRLDVWQFSGRRADYFAYLHAVLTATQGRLTIRELFDRDALRYGPRTVRGRLSRGWSQACEASGGDLHATWRGCFPPDERALVQVAQMFGNARLLACFESLAQHLDLLIRARQLLWSTLGAAALAVLVVSALVLALPAWTVPSLQQAFQGLPDLFYGPWARSLFASAKALDTWGVGIPLVALAAVLCGALTLPRTYGPWRQLLDRFGPWRLYRQIQALRMMALVSILLRPGAGGATQLRAVLVLLLQHASPWLAAHLRHMVGRLDRGFNGAAALDTGLLDRDLYWYLLDLEAAHGLQPALQAVHARMATVWFTRIRLQAQGLRWLVLLAGVASVLSIGLWHYAAIDELRRGWMMFHASQ